MFECLVIGIGIIRCGLAGVGMAFLEEVCHLRSHICSSYA